MHKVQKSRLLLNLIQAGKHFMTALTEWLSLEGTSDDQAQPPLSGRVPWQTLPRSASKRVCEYLWGRRPLKLSRQPAPVLCRPPGKEVSPPVQTEPPVLPCVPAASNPTAGHQ